MRYCFNLLLFSLLFFFSTCASSLHFDQYPKKTRRLFLNHFTNHTYQPSIHRKLLQATRKELYRRNNFQVIEKWEEASLGLRGKLIHYEKQARLASRLETPSHYSLLLVCQVSLQKNLKSTSKEQESPYLFRRELSARANFSLKQGAYQETEQKAIERLVHILALRINRSIENAYISHFRPEYK